MVDAFPGTSPLSAMNARYRGAYPSSGGVPGVRVSGTLPQRGSLCSPGTSSGFWRESEWKQPPLHPEEDVANLRAVNTVVLVLPPRPRFYVWISRTRDENDDEEMRNMRVRKQKTRNATKLDPIFNYFKNKSHFRERDTYIRDVIISFSLSLSLSLSHTRVEDYACSS